MIKNVTPQNWLEADPTSASLWTTDLSTGTFSLMSGNDWVELFSTPKLSEQVPENVYALYEVARGSLAYGYFFYPLATLACEQLFRVAETAAAEKCNLLNAPKNKTRNFQDKIKYLTDQNHISIQDAELWDSYRAMRNKVSHPEQQSGFSIGILYLFLENITNSVNKLF